MITIGRQILAIILGGLTSLTLLIIFFFIIITPLNHSNQSFLFTLFKALWIGILPPFIGGLVAGVIGREKGVISAAITSVLFIPFFILLFFIQGIDASSTIYNANLFDPSGQFASIFLWIAFLPIGAYVMVRMRKQS